MLRHQNKLLVSDNKPTQRFRAKILQADINSNNLLNDLPGSTFLGAYFLGVCLPLLVPGGIL